MTEYDQKLHTSLLELGRKLEKSQTHKLEDPFIKTIVDTMSYYNASDAQLKLTLFDLRVARYKIYDWLGMAYTGRLDDPRDSVASKHMHDLMEKFIKLYLAQKHVGGFAWWLRGHDLDVEEPSRCVDCIKSYDGWHNQTPEERLREQEETYKVFGEPIN